MQVDGGSSYNRQTASEGFTSLGSSLRAGGAEPPTGAGLPQRRAGSTRRAEPETAPEPVDTADGKGRSADDVRSMLSRFRSGVERGRQLPDPTAAISPEDRS